jgi:hypothetical protein
MTAPTAKTMLRVLSVLPAIFGVFLLVLAVMLWAALVRDFTWWLLALGVAFAVYAFYLFRGVSLGLHRPSEEFVSELCGWVAFAVLGACSLAIKGLDERGFEHLSTGVRVAAFPLTITVYFVLKRRLLRGLFLAPT